MDSVKTDGRSVPAISDEMIEVGEKALSDVIWQFRYVMPIDGMRRVLEAALAASPPAGAEVVAFQQRVQPWMIACFGEEISGDKLERGDRLLEEVFELLQSGDYPRERVRALEEYVWSRPVGEPAQEVGGVMVTLAAYCLAHDHDMHQAGETELARIWAKVDKIRAKQAAKPVGSALPIATAAPPTPSTDAVRRRAREEALEEFIALAEAEKRRCRARGAQAEREGNRAKEDLWLVCGDTAGVIADQARALSTPPAGADEGGTNG